MSPAGVDDLARYARGALIDAAQVTLMVYGVESPPARAPQIVMREHDGQPAFLCEAGSPIVTAARAERPALLAVPTCDKEGADLTVTFAGRLRAVRVERANGVPIEIVALVLTTVLVESAGDRNAECIRLEIPLDVYEKAVPETSLERYASHASTHINGGHQEDLRRFVASSQGIALDLVAGARLTGLDAYGADLHWVDTAGAHTMTIRFAEPARTTKQLGDQLCWQLSGIHAQESI